MLSCCHRNDPWSQSLSFQPEYFCSLLITRNHIFSFKTRFAVFFVAKILSYKRNIMPNNLEHKFKSLLDSCVGNTVELKKELSAHLSMSKRYIDLLYSGKQSTIPAHRALEILNFLNSNVFRAYCLQTQVTLSYISNFFEWYIFVFRKVWS